MTPSSLTRREVFTMFATAIGAKLLSLPVNAFEPRDIIRDITLPKTILTLESLEYLVTWLTSQSSAIVQFMPSMESATHLRITLPTIASADINISSIIRLNAHNIPIENTAPNARWRTFESAYIYVDVYFTVPVTDKLQCRLRLVSDKAQQALTPPRWKLSRFHFSVDGEERV